MANKIPEVNLKVLIHGGNFQTIYRKRVKFLMSLQKKWYVGVVKGGK